jgi:hypothetical protein
LGSSARHVHRRPPSHLENITFMRPQLARPWSDVTALPRVPLGPGWAGPCSVRTASGTAGPRRARAVSVGERASQVTRHPPP